MTKNAQDTPMGDDLKTLLKVGKKIASAGVNIVTTKAGDAIEGISELLKPGVLANNLTETLIRRKYHLLKRAGMKHEEALNYVKTHVSEILGEDTEKQETSR